MFISSFPPFLLEANFHPGPQQMGKLDNVIGQKRRRSMRDAAREQTVFANIHLTGIHCACDASLKQAPT
jgi:hypothetical protein